MLLAPRFSLRPALQKDANGDNLDLSIGYYVQALDRLLHSQSPNRAPILFNLAKQQFERHKLTKVLEDLRRSVEMKQRRWLIMIKYRGRRS